MATADKVVVELQAKTDAYIASVTKADAEFTAKVGHMEKEANDLANAVTRAGAKSGQAFTKIATDAPRAATAIKGMAGQTGNLAAQLNDIGVQLAGGSSPFLIAIQQGSQINQVLGQAGAGGAVRALAGAFTSMLNPVSLATFAIIGLGGAAIQYLTEFLSGSKDVERTLEEQAKLIKAVADRWGDALPALKAYSDELERATDEAGIRKATEMTIEEWFKGARKEITALSADLADLTQDLETLGASNREIDRITAAFLAVEKSIRKGKIETEEIKALQEALNVVYAKYSSQAANTFSQAIREMGEAWAYTAEQARLARIQATEALNLPGFVQPGSGGPRRGAPGNFSDLPFPGSMTAPSRLGIDDAGVYGDFRGSAKDFLRTRGVNEKIRNRIGELDDAFADGLARLLSENPDLKIISAVRTTAEQAALYNDPRVGRAAKPGRSLHEIGLAADLNRSDAAIRRRARELGIEFPFPGDDPGHVQLIGARNRGGGTGSGAGLHNDPLAAYRQDPWAGLREKTTGQIALNKQLEQSYDALAQVGVTAINGIANALADGKIEGEELLQIVLQIVQQLLTMPRIGGAQGGIFGGLLIPGILHKGGVVGRDGYTGRAVSPAVFSGANRYHGGGMAGLRSGEVPAILQRGEIVLPRRAQSGGGKQNVHVTVGTSIDGNGNIRPFVEGVTVRAMSAYDKRLNRTFGARMTDATARQR